MSLRDELKLDMEGVLASSVGTENDLSDAALAVMRSHVNRLADELDVLADQKTDAGYSERAAVHRDDARQFRVLCEETDGGREMSVYVTDATDDYWTCDRWVRNGKWTTKVIGVTGFDGSWPPPRWCQGKWLDVRRRCCAALNPITDNRCLRCGKLREAKP